MLNLDDSQVDVHFRFIVGISSHPGLAKYKSYKSKLKCLVYTAFTVQISASYSDTRTTALYIALFVHK